MKTIAQLLALLEAAQADMENYSGKALGAADDADKVKYTTLFEAKKDDFDDLSAEVESAKTLAASAKVVEDAKALLPKDPAPAPFNLNPEGQPGEGAKAGIPNQEHAEPVRNVIQKHQFFRTYMREGAKALSGQEFGAIQTPIHKQKGKAGPNSVMLPRALSAMIFAQSRGMGKSFQIPFALESHEMEAAKVMLSTDATGGVTDSGGNDIFNPEWRPQLLERDYFLPNLFDMATVVPSSNGSVTWPMLDQDTDYSGETHKNARSFKFGGVAFTWKGTEGADKADTAEPTFKDFTITTDELSGWTEMSLEMLRRSAIDLESVLIRLMKDAAKEMYSYAILHGSGTNMPLGLLGGGSGVNTIAREIDNQISWADITNVEYSLAMAQRVKAHYLVSDPAEGYLKRDLDTTGRPLFVSDFTQPMRKVLAGYPYLAHEYGPALGTEGDMVFGNMKDYMFAVEQDISIARSDEAEFKAGRVVFRMISWVGGRPIYPTSFTALTDAPA